MSSQAIAWDPPSTPGITWDAPSTSTPGITWDDEVQGPPAPPKTPFNPNKYLGMPPGYQPQTSGPGLGMLAPRNLIAPEAEGAYQAARSVFNPDEFASSVDGLMSNADPVTRANTTVATEFSRRALDSAERFLTHPAAPAIAGLAAANPATIPYISAYFGAPAAVDVATKHLPNIIGALSSGQPEAIGSAIGEAAPDVFMAAGAPAAALHEFGRVRVGGRPDISGETFPEEMMPSEPFGTITPKEVAAGIKWDPEPAPSLMSARLPTVPTVEQHLAQNLPTLEPTDFNNPLANLEVPSTPISWIEERAAKAQAELDDFFKGGNMYDLGGATFKSAIALKNLAIVGAAKLHRLALDQDGFVQSMVSDYGNAFKEVADKVWQKSNDYLDKALAKGLVTYEKIVEQIKAGAGGADWYATIRPGVARWVPEYDVDKFINLLAATSPQVPVARSVGETMRAYRQWTTEGPRSDFSWLGFHEDAALSVLRGGEPSGPKVEPFAANMKGQYGEHGPINPLEGTTERPAAGAPVVFDTHMAQGLGFPREQNAGSIPAQVGREIIRQEATPDVTPAGRQAEFWVGKQRLAGETPSPSISEVLNRAKWQAGHVPESMMRDISRGIDDTNGATYDILRDKNMIGADAFAVATNRERQMIVDGKPTPEQLADFSLKNRDLLLDGDHALGAWAPIEDGHPLAGKTVLDVVTTVPTREMAEALGHAQNQESIFDLKNGVEIPLVVKAYHRTNIPGLKILDPEFAGTNLAGKERGRAVKALNVYLEGTPQERGMNFGNVEYGVDVRRPIYDYAADKEGVMARNGANLDAAEEELKSLGYRAGQRGNSLRVFGPVVPTYERQVPSETYGFGFGARRGGGRFDRETVAAPTTQIPDVGPKEAHQWREKFNAIGRKFGSMVQDSVVWRAVSSRVASRAISRWQQDALEGLKPQDQTDAMNTWRDVMYHNRATFMRQNGLDPTGVPDAYPGRGYMRPGDVKGPASQLLQGWLSTIEPTLRVERDRMKYPVNFPDDVPMANLLPETQTPGGVGLFDRGQLGGVKRMFERATGQGEYVTDPDALARGIVGKTFSDSNRFRLQQSLERSHLAFGPTEAVAQPGNKFVVRYGGKEYDVSPEVFPKPDGTTEIRYIPTEIKKAFESAAGRGYEGDSLVKSVLDTAVGTQLAAGAEVAPHVWRKTAATAAALGRYGRDWASDVPFLGGRVQAVRYATEMATSKWGQEVMQPLLERQGADRGTGYNLQEEPQLTKWQKIIQIPHNMLFGNKYGVDVLYRRVVADAWLRGKGPGGRIIQQMADDVNAGRLEPAVAVDKLEKIIGARGRLQFATDVNSFLGFNNPLTRSEFINAAQYVAPFAGQHAAIPGEIRSTFFNIDPQMIKAAWARGDYGQAVRGLAGPLSGGLGSFMALQALNMATTKAQTGDAKFTWENGKGHELDLFIAPGWYLSNFDPVMNRAMRMTGAKVGLEHGTVGSAAEDIPRQGVNEVLSSMNNLFRIFMALGGMAPYVTEGHSLLKVSPLEAYPFALGSPLVRAATKGQDLGEAAIKAGLSLVGANVKTPSEEYQSSTTTRVGRPRRGQR